MAAVAGAAVLSMFQKSENGYIGAVRAYWQLHVSHRVWADQIHRANKVLAPEVAATPSAAVPMGITALASFVVVRRGRKTKGH